MKIFQLIYGDIPDKIKPCLDSIKKFYPDVVVYQFEKSESPVIDSDKKRVELLSEEDDILYIDWDILLTEPLEIIHNGKLCCNFYHNAPDYSIVYSPDKKFWGSFESERIRRGISKEIYGWPRKILRYKDINEIKDNYIHLRFTNK